MIFLWWSVEGHDHFSMNRTIYNDRLNFNALEIIQNSRLFKLKSCKNPGSFLSITSCAWRSMIRSWLYKLWSEDFWQGWIQGQVRLWEQRFIQQASPNDLQEVRTSKNFIRWWLKYKLFCEKFNVFDTSFVQ